VLTAIAVLAPLSPGHSDGAPAPAPLPTAEVAQLPSGPPDRKQQPIPQPHIATSALERADSQMASSQVLKAFLEGVPYKIKNQGPWTREGSMTPIGLVREITLAEPIDTDMARWPVIVWKSAENTYQRYDYNAQYSNVTSAVIYLDNDLGVVSIAPGDGATVREGPGNSWIRSLPKGEGE